MKVVKGECAGPSCAACCKVIALPTVRDVQRVGQAAYVRLPIRLEEFTPNMRYFLDTHGVEVSPLDSHSVALMLDEVPEGDAAVIYGAYAGVPVAYLRSSCAQLNKDGTCKLWGSPLRPPTCDRYPTVADQLKGIPLVGEQCTYTIEEVEGTVDEDDLAALHLREAAHLCPASDLTKEECIGLQEDGSRECDAGCSATMEVPDGEEPEQATPAE